MIDGFKSIGKAFNSGMNIGSGRGFAGMGGAGAILGAGAIGATVGASATTATDGSVDPLTGAAIGGAVGAAALPVAGMTAGGVGALSYGAMRAAPGAAMGVGKAMGAASPYVGAVGAKLGSKAASSVWSIGSKMIDWDSGADAFNKVKFTGPISGAKAGWKNNKGAKKVTGAMSGSIINGKTLMGGAAAVEGAKKAFKTVQTAKMGQMMGTDTMTPRVPSYADNAGATGDLVFALNANRRG